MLPVLLAVLAAVQGRPVWAAVALAFGAGAKVWPVVLMAPLLWPWRHRAGLVSAALVAFCGLFALQLWPIISGGLDDSSGFIGFARHWAASSAAFLVAQALSLGAAPRLVLVLAMAVVFAYASLRSADKGREAIPAMALCVAGFYLLSPSQTPWYFVWIAPFLSVFPSRALMLASVTLPLHYSYFWFVQQDMADLYRYGVVWLIWGPVWAALGWEVWRHRHAT